MKSVVSFENYREFVKQQIEANRHVRGYQSMLARAASCQPSYIVRVLQEKNDLSLDQAWKLAEFWSLDEIESDYFLDLVSLSRAANRPLQKRFTQRLALLRERHQNLKRRYEQSSLNADSIAAHYYTSWLPSACHIATSIPALQNEVNLSQRLNVPLMIIKQQLLELEAMGLVKKQGHLWKIVTSHIHLGKDSPFTSTNHNNWRGRAVLDSQSGRKNGLHYTAVLSHSQNDYDKIRTALHKTVEDIRSIIEPSPCEELTTLCLDFFSV